MFLSSELYNPVILKISTSAKRLPSQQTFSNRHGANKGLDNRTKYEMASVKQQAFIFRTVGKHSSLRIANLRDIALLAFGPWAFGPNVSRAFAPKFLTCRYFSPISVTSWAFQFFSQ